MEGELSKVVKRMLDRFEKMDFDGVISLVGPNVQGVDELSRTWLRSQSELRKYFEAVSGAVTNISGSFRDIHEKTLGDVGIFTGWLDQDYTLNGKREHVSAPTTAVLQRTAGEWKIILFHSIPMPENPA